MEIYAKNREKEERRGDNNQSPSPSPLFEVCYAGPGGDQEWIR